MRGSVRDAPREKTLNGVGDLPSAFAPSRLPDPLILLAEGCQAEKSFAQHRLRPTSSVKTRRSRRRGREGCPSVRPQQSHQKAIWLQRICKAAATTAAEKRRGGGGKEGGNRNQPSFKELSERASEREGSPPPQRGSSRRRPFRLALLLLHSTVQSRAEQSRAGLISRARNALPERELILA